MRKLLATAAAIAPLLAATGVQAEVVISTSRTTPVTTSGSNDDVRISGDGSIVVTSGTALTLDSNHDIDLDSGSDITMDKSADGSTGILIVGGNTGSAIIGGVVAVSDDQAANTDTDNDGELDGPFATGTNRYGVNVAGPGAFTGNITGETTSNISVEGNQSYGVRVQSDLVGDLTLRGVLGVRGTDSYALRTEGDVTGDVYVSGTVAAVGQGATAASIEGDVSGSLTVQGQLSSTGYRYTTRPSDTIVEKLDADDLYQGGSALVVSGNVAQGVILAMPPVDEDDEEDDEDDDGIADASEGTASIITLGEAPAIVVGADDRSITLGVAGTGDDAYGFINHGSVTAAGVYDEIDSTAVAFGGGAGQTVTVAGGIYNGGTLASTSILGDATGVSIGAGVTTPRFVNEGSMAAAGSGEGANSVAVVRIAAGANLPTFVNNGPITAIGGYESTVTGVLDESGTLNSFTNTRIIAVGNTADAEEETTGTATAIDLRANTTGVTITQSGVLYEDDDDPDTEPPLDSDDDGVPDAYEPAISGDIRMGSGADVLDIQNGAVVGDLYFGAGADRLSVSGGAVVTGVINDSDGLLDIGVSDGTLYAQQTTQATITNLDVGADGTLLFLIDPATGETPGFNVTGQANLADGAGLGVGFTSLIDGPERYTLINAGELNVGTIDQTRVDENSPYLFVTTVGTDEAAGELYVDVRQRTTSEMGLIKVETQAFDAIYNALGDNEPLRLAFLAQNDRDGFINLYEQLLPDHSGGPLLSLASGTDAVTRALVGRNASAAPGQTSAWVQEINFYADKDKTDTYGFRSEGFGIAGGVERGTGFGAFGVTAAFTSSDLEDPEAEAEEVLSASLIELGLYWRAQGQYWTTWARAAGGYATFNAQRQFVGEGVNLSNESEWHGFTLALASGASYERSFGKLWIRPEAYTEYFYLSEDARTEEGGGDGFDLAIDERDGHMFSATAAMNIGYSFGRDGWIRPELRVGWRQNISVDPGTTTARFLSGGPDFVLSPSDIEGGGPIAGVRINLGNELGMLSISADAEMIEDYVRYTLLLRASFRF